MANAADGARPHVLVVCTGNLCRSPIAAALLERRLDDRGLEATVSSAGTAAPQGASPDRRMLRAAGEFDVDLSKHRAGPLTNDDTTRSALILCMTGEQVVDVTTFDPSAASKTTTLRAAALRASSRRGDRTRFVEWAQALAWSPPGSGFDRSNDIADPVGGPMRSYRAMACEVERLVTVLADSWPAERQ